MYDLDDPACSNSSCYCIHLRLCIGMQLGRTRSIPMGTAATFRVITMEAKSYKHCLGMEMTSFAFLFTFYQFGTNKINVSKIV